MFNNLDSNFLALLQETIQDSLEFGVEMRPYMTDRRPEVQAKLWRQSRGGEEISDAIKMLRKAGANFIADILRGVGPQYGRWATNALPGQSWHQYGEAADCVWIKNGKACWEVTSDPANGYHIYASNARKNGLTNLGASLDDWVHVQLSHFNSPEHDWPHIDYLMRQRYG